MEYEKLATLIPALEKFAAEKPGAYKLRVALLAVLGYAYLLFIVLMLLAIVAVTLLYARLNWLVIKILWIPLVLVGIVLRSLWITLPEPEGAELQRDQAPALFDLIHEVTTRLHGPKIHHVLVTGEFNAAVVQIPQFGMFGWLNNYLVVGLPLLRAFTPDEFRAVLAHEVGHLSGKHGGFFAWIYRVRRSWVEIRTRVHYERHYASFLFEPFLNWYAPYMSVYSFVLARAQERQADEYAVELAGRDVTAVMLARLDVKQRNLAETFWPKFFRQSKEQPKIPRDSFEQMLNGAEQPVGAVNAQKWFFEALQVPTGYDDTHPALADRLAAIGYPKESPEVAELLDAVVKADEQKESAASHYLSDLPEDFINSQNRLWREQLVQSWNESHVQSKEAKKHLAKLEEEAAQRSLTVDEQWQRVTLLSQVQDDNAAIPLLQTMVREHPEHAGAHFALGAILLDQQNAEGVKYLEKSMELGPTIAGDASMRLSGFYFQQGNRELAETFRQRAAEYWKVQQRLREQAVHFSPDDKFLPHELSEAVLKEIQAQLQKVRGLSEAFLVRKVLEGSNRVYVLAVLAGYSWNEGVSDKHLEPLFTDLSQVTGLPSPLVTLPLDVVHGDLLPKFKAVRGASIYKRD
ncbi:MAG TPA: M48 family metalloprotease [Pyrinomonadaceae bacterium]|nr:M48 family metalloprotease [Pyrinomonadaceae bacterium]